MAVLLKVKLKDVWSKENIMASSCGKKKYNKGGVPGSPGAVAYQDEKKNVAKTRTGPKREIGPGFRYKDEEKAFDKKTLKLLRELKKGTDIAKDEAQKTGPKYRKVKKVEEMKKGGMVKKHRGDGCAMRGKTKGRMV